VQRQHRADFEDLQGRVRSEDVVDDEDTVAVCHSDANSLLRTRREELRPGERAGAQLREVEVAGAQLQELRAELVLVAVGVLLDEPVILERAQEPVDGALGQAEPLGQLAHPQTAGAGRERFQKSSAART
jgi:hypothetical protein